MEQPGGAGGKQWPPALPLDRLSPAEWQARADLGEMVWWAWVERGWLRAADDEGV